MTEIEYKTLISPPNMVYTQDEFKIAVKNREIGWKQGLNNVLIHCERLELYEYCAIIHKELKNWQ